ncbi:MAG: cytochrome P450, partial [Pseudomonadales bacterium]|nr:cytochrome P450 [Pseudomonadales bacterium]
LPIVGHLYPFMYNLHEWLDQQYQEYGPVFKFRTPIINGVYLIGPEANKFVLQNEGKIFSNYLAWEPTFESLFDNNLLQRDFRDHKTQRKILQQAFKRQAIEGHIELMNPLLEQGIKTLANGKTTKVLDFVKRLLLNTGAEVFMGVETGPKADALNQAFTDIVSATADPVRLKPLWFSPYAKGIKGNKLITDFIYDNIQQRRSIESRDMFSHLCHIRDDDGNLISDEQVKDHLIFLLFAAHDTTTSALNSILYALASNLEWQEVLRDEMFSLNKNAVEFEDLDSLEKTGWTFNEALRMYPALHSLPRYALKEFEFNNVLIPANTNVLLSTLLTHYSPEYWTKPHEFDPRRFSPERAEDKKHFYQYIPFGGGSHKCLGLHFAQVQGKIFLFHLLRNYRVTKNPSMRRYKYNNVPLTFPTDGLPLKFTRI